MTTRQETGAGKQYTVSIDLTCDYAHSPTQAAAMLIDWLRDGGLDEAVVCVEHEDGTRTYVAVEDLDAEQEQPR